MVFEALAAMPVLAWCVVIFAGGMVGSFLNVVVHRIPLMIRDERIIDSASLHAEHQWTVDPEFEKALRESGESRFNLFVPRSHCPHCGRTVRLLENVPVLSYLFLRGKCPGCGNRISLRYPVIEGLSIAAFAACYGVFGLTQTGFASAAFCSVLIAISAIDIEHMLIPDWLSMTALWGFLLLAVHTGGPAPSLAITGAAVGYGVLYAFNKVWSLIFRQVAIWNGDFKLLACVGAYLGWHLALLTLFLASLMFAAFWIAVMFVRRSGNPQAAPFGPAIAGAAVVSLFFGNALLDWYGAMI